MDTQFTFESHLEGRAERERTGNWPSTNRSGQPSRKLRRQKRETFLPRAIESSNPEDDHHHDNDNGTGREREEGAPWLGFLDGYTHANAATEQDIVNSQDIYIHQKKAVQ